MTRRTERLAYAAGLVGMLTVPAQQLSALSQTCNTTKKSFSPSQSAGATTDASQPFQITLPANVTSILIDAAGAQGGGSQGQSGGKGAEVAATFPVSGGTVLCVVAGVQGGDGSSFGGGGGGSFVFTGSNPCAFSQASATSLVLAAAGGGGTSFATAGQPGLATGLAAGAVGAVNGGAGDNSGGNGGNGGTSDASFGGGAGGGLLTDGANGVCGTGAGGKALVNGAGGSGPTACTPGVGSGGFGGGGQGGGGGYNGGGATSGNQGAGGGGSFASGAATLIFAQDGQQTGNGAVSLCYPTPVPTLSWWARLMLVAALLFSGILLIRRRRA